MKTDSFRSNAQVTEDADCNLFSHWMTLRELLGGDKELLETKKSHGSCIHTTDAATGALLQLMAASYGRRQGIPTAQAHEKGRGKQEERGDLWEACKLIRMLHNFLCLLSRKYN